MSDTHLKPTVGVLLGDPAGIGPELIARLLAEPEVRASANLLVLADPDELRDGMQVAGVQLDFDVITDLSRLPDAQTPLMLYPVRGSIPGPYTRGVSSERGGRYCLETLRLALDLAERDVIDSIVFAPLNKSSLHQAGMSQSDELHWLADELKFDGPLSEFNVMGSVWTSRVTSHVALKDVSSFITIERVVETIGLMHRALRQNGVAQPRIAVCGLNPHNGDEGSFGREEIDVIGPAVRQAQADGLPVEGPFPADTIFLKIQGDTPAFDGIVTMYHDQGQIALKLLGFWQGVTVEGGLPIPLATPAHGTAFDIVGQGKARVGPTRQAFEITRRMGLTRRKARQTA